MVGLWLAIGWVIMTTFILAWLAMVTPSSTKIETGSLEAPRYEWAFGGLKAGGSADSMATLAIMGIDPWAEIEHEKSPID